MRPIHPLKKIISFLVFSLILVLTMASGQAQRDTLRLALPSTDGTPLEVAIDSNEYVVGPGDELTIGLWGAVNQIFAVAVTPEGTALIPSVGEAWVGGLSLAKAKAEIRAVLS